MEALLFLFESLAVVILAVMAWQDDHRPAGTGLRNLFRPTDAKPEQNPAARARWQPSQPPTPRHRPMP